MHPYIHVYIHMCMYTYYINYEYIYIYMEEWEGHTVFSRQSYHVFFSCVFC